MQQARETTGEKPAILQERVICVGIKRAIPVYECDFESGDPNCQLCGLDQNRVALARRHYDRWRNQGQAVNGPTPPTLTEDGLPKGFFVYDKKVTVQNDAKIYNYHYWALVEHMPNTPKEVHDRWKHLRWHCYCGRVDKVSRAAAVAKAIKHIWED